MNNMELLKIVIKICNLSKNRNWNIEKSVRNNEHWCVHYANEYISICRLGIVDYIDAYHKLMLKQNSYAIKNNLNFQSRVTLRVVDKWLLECIRKNIPEAKQVEFRFYNVIDILWKEDNNMFIYPPEVNNV